MCKDKQKKRHAMETPNDPSACGSTGSPSLDEPSRAKSRDETEKKEEQAKSPYEETKEKIELDKRTYQELLAKKTEAGDYKDKWLRALAEYENLNKRVEKEKTETIKFSNQFLIMELFPIMDSFDSAISSIEKSNDKESFLRGLRMLQGEFHRVLEGNGLKKIKSVGERFNPNIHEAQEEICTDKFPAGIIAEEIRSGYMLNDRLLRPALVRVSKGQMKP